MWSSRPRSATSRRLMLLFALVILPPAVALVWLGATLLDQDRVMLAERARERREAAAELIARALVQRLSDAERWLVEPTLPDAVVRITRSTARFDVFPSGRVLWLPVPPGLPEPADAAFVDAESAEYGGADEAALSQYDALSRSTDISVRAGALVRQARVHRRQDRLSEALRAYAELAEIRGVAINRTPIDLVARRMSCDILAETQRLDDLAREAARLRTDLVGGRWPLDRAAWELAAADVKKWTGPLPIDPTRYVLSAAVDWVFNDASRLPASGRRVVQVQDSRVTMMWRTTGQELNAVLVPEAVVNAWLASASSRDLAEQVRVELVDEDRHVAGARLERAARLVVRSPSATGLPWTLLVGVGDPSGTDVELSPRRRLLLSGVAALVVLLAGGSHLLWRVVRRELTVAQLQTDFVAAVSHEFRTPLTSIRHITELLEESDEMPQPRRRALYGVLGQSAERLHRLVESLLDFARMEDGRRPWTFRPISASDLAVEVVASFRKERPGVPITLDTAGVSSSRIHADRAALTHALWNVLDNAHKYAPPGGAIRVVVRDGAAGVAIAVSDDGPGISAEERSEIFERFVRGRRAIEQGIAGTGLGLAMVTHIVRAHHGRVDVLSDGQRGSTFTIVLPSATSAADAAALEASPLDGRNS